MNDETQQTVADQADAGAQPPAKDSGAQDQSKPDPLDELLSQYDQGVGQAQQQQTQDTDKPADAPADDNLAARLEALEREVSARDTARDMSELVKTVRGETDVFDDDIVEAWVDKQAREDPRLRQAWMDRHKNPKQFERVAASLAGKWADSLKSQPDPNVTEDRMAVAAAVKGASKQAPSADDDVTVGELMSRGEAGIQAYAREQARKAGYG